MTEEVDVQQTEIQQTEIDDIVIDLDDELISEDLQEEEPELDEDGNPVEVDEEEEDPDVLVSNPVRQLRTVNRAIAKEKKILEQENLRLKKQLESTTAPKVEELPPEPQMSDDGIDYDADKYKEALLQWHQKKQKIETVKEQQNLKAKKVQESFDTKVQAFEKEKVNYKGIDVAQKAVEDALDINKQGILVYYAQKPALIVKALGSNPVLLSQLSAIEDPIEFALKIKDIELKVNDKMKKAPPPEPRVNGGAAPKVAGNHEKVLQKLRAEGKFMDASRYKKQHGLPANM
jgi:hypothetical protein